VTRIKLLLIITLFGLLVGCTVLIIGKATTVEQNIEAKPKTHLDIDSASILNNNKVNKRIDTSKIHSS